MEPTQRYISVRGKNGPSLAPHCLIMPGPETVAAIVPPFIRFLYFQTSDSLGCPPKTELLHLGLGLHMDRWGTFTACYKSQNSRRFRFDNTWEETKVYVVLKPLLCETIKIKRNLMSAKGIRFNKTVFVVLRRSGRVRRTPKYYWISLAEILESSRKFGFHLQF